MATTTEIKGRRASPWLGLRVLILVQNMSFSYDTRVQNIARSLARHGCSVDVLCPRYRGDPSTSLREGVRVRFFRVPAAGRGLLGHAIEYLWSLAAIGLLAEAKWRRQPFDAVHICNPPDFFFPLARAWRRRGARVIYDQHDLVPELFEARYGNRRLLALLRASERLTVANADHVLVTSVRARNRLLSLHDLHHDDVTVVPNAPDLSRIRLKGARSSSPVVSVGYLGNMNPQDGVDILLHAADFIRHHAKRRDVVFLCIGDGSSYKSLLRLRARLRLDDVVRFLGRQPPDAAWSLLARCDICVQPDPANLFTSQAMMAKTTEYMALAKPIVAFDLAETRNVCGSAARYAHHDSPRALAEEILLLTDDANLRARVGAAGRSRAEGLFNWRRGEQPLVRAYAREAGLCEYVEDAAAQVARNA